MYSVIAGVDASDSTTADRPVGDPEGAVSRGLAGKTVAFLEEAEVEGLDPEISENVERAREAFRAAGATVTRVSVPRAKVAIAIYYVVASAEASSNLARFDGVRYGPRAPSQDLLSLYVESRTRGFGPEVKRRILLGTFALSSGYHDQYYGKAMYGGSCTSMPSPCPRRCVNASPYPARSMTARAAASTSEQGTPGAAFSIPAVCASRTTDQIFLYSSVGAPKNVERVMS